MKVLIAYFTVSGNTKQIAEAICAEVRSLGHDTYLKRLDEITAEGFNGYDVVFLGSACHDSDLAKPVKKILEEIAPSPAFRLAGFVTHSAYAAEGSARQMEVYEKWAGKCPKSFERASHEKAIQWCGYFHCQGAPSPSIEAFIHREILPDEQEWQAYLADVRKCPNEKDMQKARAFARAVLAQSGDAAD